jgi:multimeric flavodoxin WrbA
MLREDRSVPRLLVVHHTPSPSIHDMVGSVLEGTRAEGLEEVEVATAAALSCSAADALAADGYVLVAPANLGTMAGALKHFFDTVYYPCLDETAGRPYGCAVHGNNDVDGALRDIERIVTGLRWNQASEHVKVLDRPGSAALEACWNLGATVAATLIT